MNDQITEKPVVRQANGAYERGHILPLMEHFYTLQGEGRYQGHAAYFIRLGGCDVGCVWCDVKESWDMAKHPMVAIEDMVAAAAQHPARLVVITGGEPLMHPLGPLTALLHKKGFKIHLETSGAHPFSGEIDWVTFSPKKFKAPLPEIYEKAHELKVVVYHKSDLKWAEGFAEKMHPDCALYLQPEWGKQREIMPLITDYVMQNPKWQVSLQTHKFMDIP